MKSLHKKISIVALIIVFGVPILSQGLVINSSLLSNKKIEIPVSEFQDYMEVKKYEYDDYYGDYYAMYLGSEKGREKVSLNYSDKWDFLNKAIKKRELKLYSRKEKDIFMKVGKSYFHVYFNLSDHKQQMMLIKDVAKHYSFDVLYASRSDYYGGRCEFESHVYNRDDLKSIPGIIPVLLKEPRFVFQNVKSFVDKLSSGRFDIPHGHSRIRIGPYDYLIFNQY